MSTTTLNTYSSNGYNPTINDPDTRGDEYIGMTQRDHVYNVSDMYVGSDERTYKTDFTYDFTNNNIIKSRLDLPQAVERIFLEIMSNASDNVGKSRREGIDPGCIVVTMDKNTITITNEGKPIPVIWKEVEMMYCPEFIFGTMLTSSHYEGDRHEAGRNGLGAKLCNIFSKFFSVEVGDAETQLTYKQSWEENMSVRNEPEITNTELPSSYVSIAYTLDFERFGYTEYPDEAFALFARHCADISFTAKVDVSFNESIFQLSNIRDYASLYFGPMYGQIGSTAIIHKQFAQGIKTQINTVTGDLEAQDGYSLPIIELMAIDAPDQGIVISFVNSLMTCDGGVHVNSALKALTDGVVASTNDPSKTLTNAKGQKNKNSEKMNKSAATIKITLADVKPHISMILSVRVVNPKFASQSKNELKSPTCKTTIPADTLTPMSKWDLVIRLYATLEAKNYKLLEKTDGKKVGHITLLKGEDANEAGKALSHNCSLLIMEGGSALGYGVNALEHIEGGRNFIGFLPMKGKPLNVMKAPVLQIAKNTELIELKKMLGLREGMDYTDDENFNTLRYGCVVIMADSDDDGKHIAGLIMLYFYWFYPSLFLRGFINYLVTPIIRVTKGSIVLKFFTDSEYVEWKNNVGEIEAKKWEPKYYKGLGSSDEKDVADDYKDPKYVVCLYDDRTPEAMNLAFNGKLADLRKDWIAAWNPVLEVSGIVEQTIHDFIHTEFIKFSVANLARSIPAVEDGLKISQRKILWMAFKHWGWSKRSKKYPEWKVAQMGGETAGNTAYKHGEKNLSDTIVGMSQNFVGTNNIPYFTRKGQFGTRNHGGKDAADARYIHVTPEKYLHYIFRQEDYDLLEILEEEGMSIEPRVLLPIIPMHLVNGCNGIGTGHSTFIPCHNPMEIICWLMNKLEKVVVGEKPGYESTVKEEIKDNVRRVVSKTPPPDPVIPGIRITPLTTQRIISRKNRPILNPWYRGFNGIITIVEKANGVVIGVPIAEVGDEVTKHDIEDTGKYRRTMVTRGILRCDGNKMVIKELPIGRWTHYYNIWLDTLVEDNIISSKTNNSDRLKVRFEFKSTKNLHEENLRLVKAVGLTNMVLLDERGKPFKSKNSEHLINIFYNIRIAYYSDRKKLLLAKIKVDIAYNENKVFFINLVRDGTIPLFNQPKATTIRQMFDYEIPEMNHDKFSKIGIFEFTPDKIKKLLILVQGLRDKYEAMLNVMPEQLWINDLEELRVVYLRVFKEKDEVIK